MICTGFSRAFILGFLGISLWSCFSYCAIGFVELVAKISDEDRAEVEEIFLTHLQNVVRQEGGTVFVPASTSNSLAMNALVSLRLPAIDKLKDESLFFRTPLFRAVKNQCNAEAFVTTFKEILKESKTNVITWRPTLSSEKFWSSTDSMATYSVELSGLPSSLATIHQRLLNRLKHENPKTYVDVDTFGRLHFANASFSEPRNHDNHSIALRELEKKARKECKEAPRIVIHEFELFFIPDNNHPEHRILLERVNLTSKG